MGMKGYFALVLARVNKFKSPNKIKATGEQCFFRRSMNICSSDKRLGEIKLNNLENDDHVAHAAFTEICHQVQCNIERTNKAKPGNTVNAACKT